MVVNIATVMNTVTVTNMATRMATATMVPLLTATCAARRHMLLDTTATVSRASCIAPETASSIQHALLQLLRVYPYLPQTSVLNKVKTQQAQHSHQRRSSKVSF